jgi:hypothetical protein
MSLNEKLIKKLIMEALSDSTAHVLNAASREGAGETSAELAPDVRQQLVQLIGHLDTFAQFFKRNAGYLSGVYGNEMEQALQQKVASLKEFLEPLASGNAPVKKLSEGVGSSCSLEESQIRQLGIKVRELHNAGYIGRDEGLGLMEALRYAAGL